MEDPAVFTNFVKNTLRVTTQQMIDGITNFVESFGELLAVNNGYIEPFSRIPILQIMEERLRRES